MATSLMERWTEQLQSAVPFWKSWALISQYQRDIWENYRNALSGGFQNWLQLAPTYLSQSINPWSFSLFQFTKEIRGTPNKEYKILTEVAGYGSQLGTIMDYLEVLEKNTALNPEALSPEDNYRICKFHDLVEQIRKAKNG